LAVLGYEVSAAASGREALELFDSSRADAVLLDLAMPGMDGRATYLALRERDPSVRALITTGYSLNEEVQHLLDLGVRGFLPKPCGLDELSAALARVLA
jgi:DNA-binding NarL/FixJ family response regulator